MIRIALVEDDPAYRREFKEFLRRFESEEHQQFRITEFTDGDEITENYRADFDIILMDIAMRFMDGMSAAEQIRRVDSETIIIFITNLSQYAMKGYAVDAMDYVLKPVTYFAFSQRISKAIHKISNRSRRHVSIPIKGGMQKLDTQDILYVEVRNHDLLYHTRAESVLSRGTLTSAEELLGSNHFFRISKCYLVNLDYVDSIHNGSLSIDGIDIPFSRSHKKELLDALNNYMNEVQL